MDTFPAGTLTGAPKHKALNLIEKYEKVNRNFYGGAIGYMDFEGNFNHAIIIRSFLSKNNTLSYHCLLYTSPSPRDYAASRMPSSA